MAWLCPTSDAHVDTTVGKPSYNGGGWLRERDMREVCGSGDFEGLSFQAGGLRVAWLMLVGSLI